MEKKERNRKQKKKKEKNDKRRRKIKNIYKSLLSFISKDQGQ